MSSLKAAEVNALAQKFKSLHKPGDPVVLANVHDAVSAQRVASDPLCKALASASWSIAATQGIDDDDMTLDQNLQGIHNVTKGIANAGKFGILPFSVDLQDGYEDIKESVKKIIALGGVGANIEDVDCKNRKLRTLDDAVDRIKQAAEAAVEADVPDFVINARVDAFGYGGSMEDVKQRASAYLAAGATAAFVWGVRTKEITYDEIVDLCKHVDGKLAVHGPGPTELSVEDLRRAGVCRISIGPFHFRKAMEVFENGSKSLMAA